MNIGTFYSFSRRISLGGVVVIRPGAFAGLSREGVGSNPTLSTAFLAEPEVSGATTS